MKKLLLVLAAAFCAPFALAQETYSISANANQVTDLTAIVGAANTAVCDRLGLAIGCTQAQACTGAQAPGGASCTAAQARSVNARIYPQTQAGREEFVVFEIAAPKFQELRFSLVLQSSQKELCDFWATAPRAGANSKDNVCSAAGLPTSVSAPTGCELCR